MENNDIIKSQKEIIDFFMTNPYFKKQVCSTFFPKFVYTYYMNDILESLKSSKKINKNKRKVNIFISSLFFQLFGSDVNEDLAIILIKQITNPSQYNSSVENQYYRIIKKLIYSLSYNYNIAKYPKIVDLLKAMINSEEDVILYKDTIKDFCDKNCYFKNEVIDIAYHRFETLSLESYIIEAFQNKIASLTKSEEIIDLSVSKYGIDKMNISLMSNPHLPSKYCQMIIDHSISSKIDFHHSFIRNDNLSEQQLAQIFNYYQNNSNMIDQNIIESFLINKSLNNEVLKTIESYILTAHNLINPKAPHYYILGHLNVNHNTVFLHDLHRLVQTIKKDPYSSHYFDNFVNRIQKHENYNKNATLILDRMIGLKDS